MTKLRTPALAAKGEEAFAQLKQEHSVSEDRSLTRYVNYVSSAILAVPACRRDRG